MGLDTICDNEVGIVEWPELLDGIMNFSIKVNIQYSIKQDLHKYRYFY